MIPFPESALNEEASRLFMESYDEYAKLARMHTELHALPKVVVEEKAELIVEKPEKKEITFNLGQI